MKIIHGSRGSGKSTNCIAYAWITNSTIIVSDLKRKSYLDNEAYRMGYSNVEVITIQQYMSTIYGNYPKSIIIDELDDVLHYIFNADIAIVTTSCKIKELGRKL